MPDGTQPGAPQQHELAVLFPAPRNVTIADRVIEIKRCTIAQGGRLLDVGLPLWKRYGESGDDPVSIFETHPAEATALLHAATGAEIEWLATLDPVDQLALGAAWFEINAAFFVRRLFPSLLRMRLAIATAFGNGRTLSQP
jgi:hypothetical protein